VSGPSAAGPSPVATGAIQHRLDAFLARATPVYHTREGDVPVAIPFRMSPGYAGHEGTVRNNTPALRAVARSIGVSDGEVSFVQQGRATPAQVRRLAQGLIDAGRLPKGGGTLADRVRQMMFDHGLGLDCAGYARQAFAAAHPGASVAWRAPVNENLSGLAGRGFARLPLSDARAGDLIVLRPPSPSEPGHTLIVYATREATEDDRKLLGEPGAKDVQVQAVARSSSLHVLVVDSSWGCNGDATRGGVRRVTLFEDRVSQQWVSVTKEDRTYTIADTPYAHPVDGAYRLQGGH
jgi:hypothetical protein